MKLAIYTQYRENYGAHDWNGEGECPQHWKNKGGETYIFEDISVDQACRVGEEGIPTLKSLIEYSDEYAEEYVIEWDVIDECEKVAINDWETPLYLRWDGDNWVVNCSTDISDYSDKTFKHEEWTLLPKGERDNYKCEYE